MATIKDYISLQDGFSPVFNKISSSAETLSNKLNRVSGAMNKVQNANSQLSMTQSVFIGGILAQGVMAVTSAINGQVRALISLSDTYSNLQARLGNIVKNDKELLALNKEIYDSAERSRGSYMGMAQLVAKLSQQAKDVFASPKDTVGFAENVQKLFAIGGSSSEEQRSAMLQLGQALASGRLQGDEFRSISENAPMLQNIIAEHMGVTRGELRKLSSQGVITADVIKDAILGASDKINEQFSKIPLKWEDAMTSIKNTAITSLVPTFNIIKDFINSPEGRQMVEDIKLGIKEVGKVVFGVANGFIFVLKVGQSVFHFLTENSWILKGVLAGVITALAMMSGHLIKNTALALAHATASGLETASILALTVAQNGFNVAVRMCPLTWLIGIVALCIGAVFGLVEMINHFYGTSISVIGLVCGLFWGFGAVVYNVFVSIWNTIITVAFFFATVWKHPLDATYNLFATIWNGIISLVQGAVNTIIDTIKLIPGMDKAIGDWKLSGGKVDLIKYEGVDTAEAMKLNTLNVSNEVSWAYNSGSHALDGVNLDNVFGGGGTFGDGGNSDAIKNNTDGTAKNTKAMKDAMENSEEDLKFLREMAEREAVNKYTTAQVNIDLGGFHNYNDGNTDFDGMVRHLTEKIEEAVINGGEVVSA